MSSALLLLKGVPWSVDSSRSDTAASGKASPLIAESKRWTAVQDGPRG